MRVFGPPWDSRTALMPLFYLFFKSFCKLYWSAQVFDYFEIWSLWRPQHIRFLLFSGPSNLSVVPCALHGRIYTPTHLLGFSCNLPLIFISPTWKCTVCMCVKRTGEESRESWPHSGLCYFNPWQCDIWPQQCCASFRSHKEQTEGWQLTHRGEEEEEEEEHRESIHKTESQRGEERRGKMRKGGTNFLTDGGKWEKEAQIFHRWKKSEKRRHRLHMFYYANLNQMKLISSQNVLYYFYHDYFLCNQTKQ